MRPWHFGNTSVRSPFRLLDGLMAIQDSPLQGNLHGTQAEKSFRHLLGERGVVELGVDATDSIARKWRAALSQLGFLVPSLHRTALSGLQERVGQADVISPNGQRLLKSAGSVPAIQECFLRSLGAYAVPSPIESDYGCEVFRPLLLVLKVMLALEDRFGDSTVSFLEMAVIVQLATGQSKASDVVEDIARLRRSREAATSVKAFDQNSYAKVRRANGYVAGTYRDYADLNFRYLKATGLVQAKGRGIALVPTKRNLIVKLALEEGPAPQGVEYFKSLCEGRPLPTDDVLVAKQVLRDLGDELKKRGLEAPRPEAEDAAGIAVARHTAETLLLEACECDYAVRQADQVQEILDFMDALNSRQRRSGKVSVPKGEAPAYLEWVLWRAFLAINSVRNPPYEARRFRVGPDFLPISPAPGGGPDMFFEFDDYAVAIEVTLTEGSRQEAVEGESVRRHVANFIHTCNKPVFGLFLSVRVDPNTLETFRHGVWYFSEDQRTRLNIVPLSLAEFKHFFSKLMQKTSDRAEVVRDFLTCCSSEPLRDHHDAIAWHARIRTRLERPELNS